MPFLRRFRLALLIVLIADCCANAQDAFQTQVSPFLKQYCVHCHNPQKAEGELDLARFTSAKMVGEYFRQWETVITFLKKGEMPPEKEKQPPAELRAQVLSTLESLLLKEAAKLAGDPGAVLPRRLSNAEYNNTIRDLTGVDIQPAESFPVDPASGEGFNNTGEALTMSPSLFKKYYAAAQHVADHVLLKPTGIDFAPHTVITFADQKQYYEQAILRFYEQHRVKYDVYLQAAWTYRHRPSSQKNVTVEQWASQQQLSPRYLRRMWEMLSGKDIEDKFYLQWLRQRWNAIPAPANAVQNNNAPAVPAEVTTQINNLATAIQRLSSMLCSPETPAIVPGAGNGPIQHIDRRKKTAATRDSFNESLLSDSRRFHIEFKNVANKSAVTLVFHASNRFADGEGVVVLKELNFSGSGPNNYNRNDKKNVSLRTLLAKHASDELERLNFGVHPQGHTIGPDSIAVSTSRPLEITLPSKAFLDAPGSHFYAEAQLDREHSKAGIVQFALLDRQPKSEESIESNIPLIHPQSPRATQFKSSSATFCATFPNRFYFADDTRGLSAGFHLIEGFFRDDAPLCKLVLDDHQNRTLDRLWNELYFGTQIQEKMLRGFVFFERSERNFMKHPDFDSIKEEDPDLVTDGALTRFEQIYLRRSNVQVEGKELAEHPIHLFFDEIRQGLKLRSAQLATAEPAYLKQLLAFAERAYRRPLTDKETKRLESFYQSTSQKAEFGVEGAVRGTVVAILVSPYFCYRAEPAPEGKSVAPLSDLALASRLSYFLWSSQPDDELFALAKAGKLNNEASLRAQTRRMLKDDKVSSFALEFFGQWLRYRDFLQQESVDRSAFPDFDDALKRAMFEEPTRLATHLIQNDLPVTDLLYGDITFVNKRLAKHYNATFSAGDRDWQKIDGTHQMGRGGLLGMAVFLTENSQPQRTSPVKRGFWVVHKILGEHIPAPPADVAVLPAKETDTNGKTIRELLAMHTEDVRCARCHQRFDPIGLSMEGFDPIGRVRTKDLAGRSIDNVVRLANGKEARGVPEFLKLLEAQRNDEFIQTLCRKFLGYALGRSVELSDQPLLDRMQSELKANGYRVGTLFETVVTSPQFRNQRCREFSPAEFTSATATAP